MCSIFPHLQLGKIPTHSYNTKPYPLIHVITSIIIVQQKYDDLLFFRYIAGPDGLKRLQTVRFHDDNIVTPEIGTFIAPSVVQDDQDYED